MSDQRPTEPLRVEHRELLPHVLALDAAASATAGWDREAAVATLADIVRFLRGHLVPHAAAEEAVLYPAVEDAMGRYPLPPRRARSGRGETLRHRGASHRRGADR